MGQVTIYIEDELEAKMRAAAKSMKLSQSKWIANMIRERLTEEWPASVKQLAGAWHDFPSTEETRAEEGKDLPRESL